MLGTRWRNTGVAADRDGGGRLSIERSWPADERTAAKIESQEALHIPRNADPDALPDFAGFMIVVFLEGSMPFQ